MRAEGEASGDAEIAGGADSRIGRRSLTMRMPGSTGEPEEGVLNRGRGVWVATALIAATWAPARAEEAPPPRSDPAAVALAQATLEKMGGREGWERTRYLQWRFLGRRTHSWDRWTGDVRIESEKRLVLMNLNTREGRAWDDGVEITDPAARRKALDLAYAWWVNDSYWLIMPFKLLDPGVHLRSLGEDEIEGGRAADVIEVTFDPGVGLTPQNKYRVWIARDTGLVEQWAYYENADDPEPAFTRPWTGWQRFGAVLIATEHGRDADWEIAAPAKLPRALFERP